MDAPFRHIDGRFLCEDVPAAALVAEFGTPLYVYSRRAIVERYREFDRAFAPVDHLIAYSVKANGNLGVLRLLGEEGSGADVVSGGELHRAGIAGIPPERILFSGVGKTASELARALDAGIYAFNVESAGELEDLARLGAHAGVRAPVALRVNPDIESPTPHPYTRTGHRATKFGIPYENARSLYRFAAQQPGLAVRGVDVHIGSQIRDTEPYRECVDRILELVDTLCDDGIALEFLDVGGGFGVAYEDDAEPAAADFAAAILPRVTGTRLRLVLEPGRFIVGPAGVLLTRVLYVKENRDKVFVVTDAGMNDLLRPSHYASFHRVEPVHVRPEREVLNVDVVGPICETGDFLALDRPLARPEPGELLAIRTVGAYGFSMASTYNARPRPAEVMVDGGERRLVRRREGPDDLVRGEVELLE